MAKTGLYPNNILLDNRASNNPNGFRLFIYSGNTLEGNTADNNVNGFFLSSSPANTLFHNNIIGNSVQATDFTPPDNDWHHPVLLDGNFWSDYLGVDDGSGTGKHAIAGDGIGDTQIPHPRTDFDDFPFVVESGWVLPVAISVDIDSNARDPRNVIRPHSGDPIAVVIFSTADFDAPGEVDRSSLTFGRTGDEESLVLDHSGDPACGAWDFNLDGLLDLYCLFNPQATGFQVGDTEGILRGITLDGVPIEGRGSVVIES